MRRTLLIFIILLALLEITAHLFYPYQDRLEKILNVLEQDPLFFWRHKPNLNISFQGCDIKINSQGFRADREYSLKNEKGILRIMCLGASPTFGWGVDFKYAYPRQLEEILRSNYKQYNFEVINAGIIGYSSYQGLLFLKNEILKYSPDIITVAYVINDVDRYRFFRSDGRPDKELQPLNPLTVLLKNIYKKSSLYNLAEKWLLKLKDNMRFTFVVNPVIGLPQARVSAQDYQHNLEEIIRIARDKGIKIIFIKMPVNLPTSPYVSDGSKAKARKLIFLAVNSMKSARFKEAISELEEAIVLNPYSCEAYFYQGASYVKIKRHDLSKRALDKSKGLEVFNCSSDSKKYNKIMEEVAARNNVTLVDIASAFGDKEEKGLFVDPKLDPIHPSNLGHRIIAEELFKSLTQGIMLFANSSQ